MRRGASFSAALRVLVSGDGVGEVAQLLLAVGPAAPCLRLIARMQRRLEPSALGQTIVKRFATFGSDVEAMQDRAALAPTWAPGRPQRQSGARPRPRCRASAPGHSRRNSATPRRRERGPAPADHRAAWGCRAFRSPPARPRRSGIHRRASGCRARCSRKTAASCGRQIRRVRAPGDRPRRGGDRRRSRFGGQTQARTHLGDG